MEVSSMCIMKGWSQVKDPPPLKVIKKVS